MSECEEESRKFSIFETYMIDLTVVALVYLAESKFHNLSRLNNCNLFLTVWRPGSLRSRCQSVWFSGDSVFHDFQITAFSVCPLMPEAMDGAERGRTEASFLDFLL